ncbi:MAG TPA: GntR family transcriptional regulator [Pseudolabrys sp.]|nr:GntR family transcriptional regulator [Pseudolabrys sp.]
MSQPQAMPVPRPPDDPQSDLTTRLRDAITRGQLSPNERLVEADLAAAYGVNRANIRMALAMLDQEGLVVRERHRGARVRAVSDTEAMEIAQTRLAIEVMIAGQAATRVTETDRKTLRAIIAQMRICIERGDLPAFSDANAALHQEIHRIADNQTARRILQTLKSHIVRLQYRVILLPGRPKTSLAEHRRIVDALCAGDRPAAEAAMRAHLTSFVKLLKDAIAAARSGGF